LFHETPTVHAAALAAGSLAAGWLAAGWLAAADGALLAPVPVVHAASTKTTLRNAVVRRMDIAISS
jgi:hypothetical protein